MGVQKRLDSPNQLQIRSYGYIELVSWFYDTQVITDSFNGNVYVGVER